MLKTNSKKAKENIKNYIIDHFNCDSYIGYTIETAPEKWEDIATFILNTFKSEKYSKIQDFKYYHYNEYAAFIDWCSGLPSVLDTCYYYNRSAVNDLSMILEETETEKSKYTESQAEERLTYLIYRELKKAFKCEV